jgi:hypothetical protein
MKDDHSTELVPSNILCSNLKEYTEKFLEGPAKPSVADIGQPFTMPHSIGIMTPHSKHAGFRHQSKSLSC